MAEIVKNQIILNDVRIDRVSLTQPYKSRTQAADPNKKDKYHLDAILAQAHPQFAQLQEVIRGVAAARWKDQAAQTLAMISQNNMRFCLQRGDQYRPGKPQYAGLLYISAGNEEQPTIVVSENGVNIANRNTPTVLTPSHPCWPYAGSYCNVQLQFYCYTYQNSPGLAASVLGVQFYRHGERLRGASVSSVSEFGIVPSAADGAPPSQPAGGGAGLI
jgi:Protein of unknown function (DUF2815)